MIMRIITLLRGVLVSMRVFDVSSALLWRPLALQVCRATPLRACRVWYVCLCAWVRRGWGRSAALKRKRWP